MSNGKPETVKELYFYLDGQFKTFNEVIKFQDKKLEKLEAIIKRQDTTINEQIKLISEIKEECCNTAEKIEKHIDNHWKINALLVSISGIIITLFWKIASHFITKN